MLLRVDEAFDYAALQHFWNRSAVRERRIAQSKRWRAG